MSESKSMKLSRPCILMPLLFLITTMHVVVANDAHFRKQINDDLLTEINLDYYLNTLEKTVEFCVRHKLYVDLNLQFGLFLVNVNLKQALQREPKSIPNKIRSRLERLLTKNSLVSSYFHDMVQKHKDEKASEQDIILSQLLYDNNTWPRPSDEFNKNLLELTKYYSPEKLEQMYGKWDKYFTFVLDTTQLPSPADSGDCLAQLASSPVHNRKSQSICEISPNCKGEVDKGSEYGYGLLHRLLLMVVARFSRQCVVLSKRDDKHKTNAFCMLSFNEAEYIASNGFHLPDLMFEQISLCGLLGHAQFYRNFWFKSLLQYQTPEGCFTQKLATGEFNENMLRERKNDTWKMSNLVIMNGQCDGQFTAVAAAALSNALRYIIETYY